MIDPELRSLLARTGCVPGAARADAGGDPVVGDQQAVDALCRALRRRGDADRVAERLTLDEADPASWQLLTHLLDAELVAAPVVERWLDDADWPDRMRRLPPRWLRATVHGRARPWFGVCRAADVHGPVPLQRVLRASALDRVRHLRVRFAGRFGACVDALALADHRALDGIDLGFNELCADELACLLELPVLHGLERLRLDGNALDAWALSALADARLDSLRHLECRRTGLRSLAGLVAADFWDGLQTLAVEGNPLRIPRRLALSPKLRSLSLGPVGAEMLHVLAARSLPWLQTLAVFDSAIDAGVAATWARAQWWSALMTLDLAGCDVAPEAAATLRRAAGERIQLTGLAEA